MMQLDDKLYTSTEVADILGVSLRSIYRYLEDNKLIAEVKTATGRHRFTKQNIIDFLYPDGNVPKNVELPSDVSAQTPVSTPRSVPKTSEVFETVEDDVVVETPKIQEAPAGVLKEPPIAAEPEEVDWLSKFREAAAKFETKEEEIVKEADVMGLAPEEKIVQPSSYFYRSSLGGLRDIAQNIDKSARMSGVDYAFTLNAGLSLSKPIKPFSVLHAYIRSADRELFEKMLKLQPSDEETAQLCLLVSDDVALYSNRVEMHGLHVVSNERLLADIKASGDAVLVSEAESVLG